MDKDPKEQFAIEVNGIEIKLNHEKLVAIDVLKLAAERGAFTGNPEEYILESDNPKHEFKSNDWVDFRKYKEFTAERSALTPVAKP